MAKPSGKLPKLRSCSINWLIAYSQSSAFRAKLVKVGVNNARRCLSKYFDFSAVNKGFETAKTAENKSSNVQTIYFLQMTISDQRYKPEM